MRNFTPTGELKVRTGNTGAGSGSTEIGTVLAAGVITPLVADPEGVAELQALSAAEDLDGLALSQAPADGVPLVLESGADVLIPPRVLAFTSVADLSGIEFEISGLDSMGMQQIEQLAGPAGAPEDADGIAQDQAPAASTPLVLEAVAATLDPPRALTFTSATDLSGVTFEIVGLDENGDPQTVPAFTGPDNDTLATSELWSEVSGITPDSTDAGTLSVGWPDTAAMVLSTVPYASVIDVTPDGTDAGTLEVGWRASDVAFALTLINPGALGSPRRITLSSTDNLAAVQFQLVGTDEDGEPLNETIDGPDNGTVTSAGLFSEINIIQPLELVVGSISAGWPDELYRMFEAQAPASISHLYLRNTVAQTQEIDLRLWTGSIEVAWRHFELEEDESASVLMGEPPLPIPQGAQIRVAATDPGAVSFTLHGIEGEG